jgi:ABC-type nitrate/sulfonate/bicarbonate transport system substrate-binding protein
MVQRKTHKKLFQNQISPNRLAPRGLRKRLFWVWRFAQTSDGVKSYSMSIIANNNSLNPDVSRRVVKATLLAFNEMVTDNSAALAAFFAANPTANKEFEKRKLERLTQFIRKNLESQGKAGAQTLQGWQQTQDFLFSQKLISKRIDLSTFFTSEFLPQ